jgi:hypothetical protein
VDLLGSEYICVNDSSVRYALLADNDVLKVGRYRIRIQSRVASRGQAADPVGTTSANLPWGRVPLKQATGPFPDASGFPLYNQAMWSESNSHALSPINSAVPSTGVEWSRPTPDQAVQIRGGELTDAVLVPLVNQFGLMQQQMLDQFQDAISRLVQMFGSLHRDQMDVIRAELDQLRDLTSELHALKLELTAHSHPNPEPAANSLTAGVSEERRTFAPSSENNYAGGAADQLVGPYRGVGSIGSPANERATNGSGAAASSMNGSSAPAGASIIESKAEGPRTTPKSPEPAEESRGGSDKDVILWLHQRMMTLQQERETRWQKILKLLPGLS